MAAYFRFCADTEALRRFQTLAALWSTIPANQQTLITSGAKFNAKPAPLFDASAARVVKYDDSKATAPDVKRLRFVAGLWGNITSEVHANIIEHARRVAKNKSIPLAAIAGDVESLTIGKARVQILKGDGARAWATLNGQLLGTIRPEYEGWCANSEAVIAKGRNIAPLFDSEGE